MKFRIGELDQRISFYRPVETPDGQGGFTVSDTLLTTVWAKVMAPTGGEIFKFEKVEGIAAYTFVVRRTSGDIGIREGDYILWESEKYNIRLIPKVSNRDLYLRFVAERGVAE